MRLTFDNGAHVDVLTLVPDDPAPGADLWARPPLSPDTCALGGDRGADPDPRGPDLAAPDPAPQRAVARDATGRRARPSWPRGAEGRRSVAQTYRAAQSEGRDPVLAVMWATGRSRRRSLRMIAAARDAGFLAPRHNRR
ncbi:hypothetical protein J3486_02810 [Streptomyces sp. VRA16 Mangrove soil]|nr:hypothetical protein [Streptomyces sp. VRA16 Mangrove soil]